MVNEKCEVKDKMLCDIMPMDVCHILLGRPWLFERDVIHDWKKKHLKITEG